MPRMASMSNAPTVRRRRERGEGGRGRGGLHLLVSSQALYGAAKSAHSSTYPFRMVIDGRSRHKHVCTARNRLRCGMRVNASIHLDGYWVGDTRHKLVHLLDFGQHGC